MELEEVVKNYQNRYLMSTPMYTDMGGGLNARVAPAEMKISQSRVSKNIIYNAASGALVARDGTKKLISTIFPLPEFEDIYGMFQAPFSTGKKILINTSLKVWAWVSPAWTNITGTAVRTAPASSRVNMVFYNDMAIGVDGSNVAFKVPNTLVAAPLGGTPPVCKFVLVWNDYVVMAGDGTNKVYYSERQEPENWPVANYLVAGGDTDGDPITGIAVAYGHLIIFKRNSIFAVSGATEADFSMSQIGRSVGLVAENALCNAENDVWFLGPSGMYTLGSDLSPTFMSDFVLPRYQAIISHLTAGNANLPAVVFNSSKQQVWVSVDANGDGYHDKVMVHDLVNKDSTGRPAVSEYYFYDGGTEATNYNPRYLSQYLTDTNEPRVISLNRNNYVYLHDATVAEDSSVVGDDGFRVEWEWQSKYLNLGDPTRIKALRYYTVLGNSVYGDQSNASGRTFSYNTATSTWAELAQMGTARRMVAVASLGAYVYCAGGSTGSASSDRFERYNPGTNVWERMADLPEVIQSGALVSDGTYLYHIGGYSVALAAYSPRVYRYSPTLNTWAAMTSMPTARAYHAAAVVGGVIYAIGGYDGVSALSTNEAYNIALGTWSTKTAMTTARYLLTSTAINDKIYCIGGTQSGGLQTNEEYDTALDSWATKAAMATPVYEHSAAGVGNDVYILGGFLSPSAKDDVLVYSTTGNSYSAGTDMIVPNYFAGATAIGSVIYMAGGVGLPHTMGVEIGDTFSNTQRKEFSINLNSRQEIPSSSVGMAKFFSVFFRSYIVVGITQLNGWNLDYTMFQRRN